MCVCVCVCVCMCVIISKKGSRSLWFHVGGNQIDQLQRVLEITWADMRIHVSNGTDQHSGTLWRDVVKKCYDVISCVLCVTKRMESLFFRNLCRNWCTENTLIYICLCACVCVCVRLCIFLSMCYCVCVWLCVCVSNLHISKIKSLAHNICERWSVVNKKSD